MPRASVDPRFGRLMSQLRASRGLSLRALAGLVYLSKSRLHEFEASSALPTVDQARQLDAILDANGDLVDLLLVTQGGVVSTDALEFASTLPKAVEVAAGLWRGDLARQNPLRRAAFVATAFVAPAMRAMLPADEHPTGQGDRPVEEPDVDTIRRMTATLRSLDNCYGGGQVRETAVRFLASDVAPLLRTGRYSEHVGRGLLSATAELTLMAGWATHDTGLHGLAQRYLIQALRLAMGAGDLPLGAEVLAAMSHQATYLGAATEAVDLARAAGRIAADAGGGAIHAEALVLEAHGYAVAGEEQACAAALSRAEQTLDRADRGGDPQWIGYFDEAYLSARFGHCFVALSRGDLARRFAERSLHMDERYARGKQFNLALLARAHAQAGDVDKASAVGIQAVEAAATLRSTRSADYLRDLADRLAPHCGLAVVRDFTDRAHHLLQPALGPGEQHGE
ncbi:MAG TPA: helix-turn-helix transcriptional regulator [Micromonosporaceae bacterium]|nr:helix-turn-helix transcriptional regulator [Micromonosporaceae bacterium]